MKAQWAPDGRTVLCFSDWGVSLNTLSRNYPETILAAASLLMVINKRHRDIYPISYPSRQRSNETLYLILKLIVSNQVMLSGQTAAILFLPSDINLRIPWVSMMLPKATNLSAYVVRRHIKLLVIHCMTSIFFYQRHHLPPFLCHLLETTSPYGRGHWKCVFMPQTAQLYSICNLLLV